MKNQCLFFLGAVLLFNSFALAQEASSTLSLKEDAPSNLRKPFHLTLSLSNSSTMYKETSHDREGAMELFLNPSLDLTEETSLGLQGSVIHEETQAQNTAVSNTSLTLKTKGPQLGVFESTGSITGTAPTNEDDRKLNRLQGAATLGGSLKTQWRNLSLAYGLGVTRNFHQYTVNSESSPNVQYSLNQILSVDAELTPLWSLSLAGLFKRGWTYRDYQRDAFGFESSLNLNVNKNLAFSAGVATEGDTLKANGSSSNINIYNENTSVIKAGVTFTN